MDVISGLDSSFDDTINDQESIDHNQKQNSYVSRNRTMARNILFSRYFNVRQNDSGTEYQNKNTAIITKCKTCNVEVKGTVNVTSNFLRHLKKHESVFQKYIQEKSLKKENDKDDLNKLLTEIFAHSLVPFTLLECKPFKLFLNKLNSNYQLPSRPTVMKLLKQNYIGMKEDVKCQIKKAGVVCTTADIWSTTSRSFFGYTCHWLDERLNRKSVALACRRFPGSHTYLKINEILHDIHSEYDLNSANIMATVTDNGSNFVKTFKIYGIESYYDSVDFVSEEDNYEFHNEELDKYLPTHIRCCSHTLSLLATKDYENNLKKTLDYECHKTVLQNCSHLWNKSRRPNSAEKMKSILGFLLKSPVITRWNSLYDSFVQILEFKEKVKSVCYAVNIPCLTENDFTYIQEYTTVNKPIAEALDFLQQDKNILFGYMLPTLATIRTQLRILKNHAEFKIINKEIVDLMEKSLVERFSKYFELESDVDMAVKASVLCPDVKLNWVQAINPSLNHLQIEEIGKRIKLKIENEMSDNTQPTVIKPKNSYFNFDINDEIQTYSSAVSAKNEYLNYMIDSDTELEMLNRYPKLKTLFKKYNTPLPSSAPVERMFSYAGLVNAPRRSSLTDKYFEHLVLLKVNVKYE